ncbi:response regulator [Croceibacterium aestuarii]|uniref:response regulator n=1 Tax=Croceibacterium aestuarii TaxID=3064139 RepID=UPI00272E44C6|nr:response regulator [Croceibacterium sp. D39]
MAFILIAESDPNVAERAADALAAAGFACGWVTDADQTRTLLRCRQPDLILLDANMPGRSEGHLLRELRSSEQCRDTPIILLTAASGRDDPAKSADCGAQDFIRKPFDPRFLVWRVNHAVGMLEARPKLGEVSEWPVQQQHGSLG